MSDSVVSVHSKHELLQYLKCHKYVILDCYADWCGPCKNIAPKFKEYAQKYSSYITALKYNVDEDGDLKDYLDYLNVDVLPTFILYKDGNIYGKYTIDDDSVLHSMFKISIPK